MATNNENEIINRIKLHLESISIDFNKLCTLLKKHNAFISGSYLLGIIRDNLFSEFADVDIYVISQERDIVLEREIYELINKSNNIHITNNFSVKKINDDIVNDDKMEQKEKIISKNEKFNEKEQHIIDIDNFEQIKNYTTGLSVGYYEKKDLNSMSKNLLAIVDYIEDNFEKNKEFIMDELVKIDNFLFPIYNKGGHAISNGFSIFLNNFEKLLYIKKQIQACNDTNTFKYIEYLQQLMIRCFQFKENYIVQDNSCKIKKNLIKKYNDDDLYQFYNFASFDYTNFENSKYALNPNINFVMNIDSNNKLIATHQLIYFKSDFTPKEIVDNFDLDFCSNYFDGENIYIKNYLSIVNSSCIMTLDMYHARKVTDRIGKYIDRGFSVKIQYNDVIFDLIQNGEHINNNSTNFAINVSYIDINNSRNHTYDEKNKCIYDIDTIINKLPIHTQNIILIDGYNFNPISKKLSNLPVTLENIYILNDSYAKDIIKLSSKLPFGCEIKKAKLSDRKSGNEIIKNNNKRKTKIIK